MRRPFRFGFASLWLAAWLAFAGCQSSSTPSAPKHATLERRVMVGYQGWFRAPGDGTDLGWSHYQNPRTRTLAPGQVGIDYWPDTSELTPAEKFATPLKHADGSTAFLFSSHHPLTVDRHFKWMRDYGIDGAFVQRFPTTFLGPDARSQRQLRATDDILNYARAGAERHGRSFVVMFDLSGLRAGAMERVKADWRHLVDDLKIRASPAYQHHRGKPLVAVWGIGFNDGRAYTLDECGALLDFLKNDPVYGGNTVMLGIPSFWREQRRDTTSDPALHALLAKADVLSPWTPGRYRDLAGIEKHAAEAWRPDRAWCAERGIDYLPVVFPGFSWRNLKDADGGIDRLEGRFLWAQYRTLVNDGCTMIYQAMFDEVDEGTQIFKVTSNPPVETKLLTYAPLPADHYLWLVGTAADHLRHGRPLPEGIPVRRTMELGRR